MDVGHFYFLKEEYFEKFTDSKLMKNKEENGRPCFYSFIDKDFGLCWMIPISSNVNKYKKVYDNKIKRFGVCHNLLFGEIFGKSKAFLIQNMCPTTFYYIEEEYLDKNKRTVRIDRFLEQEIILKSRNTLKMVRKGMKLILPDVLTIESQLLKELQ